VHATFLDPEQESQNSAIFQNWHTPCNVVGMGRKSSILTQEGNKMTFASDYTARITAALAAVVVTTTILVSSFSTPQASIIASIIA
jgi:hypothetical protein